MSRPAEAQAWQIHLPSTPADATTHLSPTPIHSNLKLTDVLVPAPPYPPGHALVRITHASLNYRDLLSICDSPLYPVTTINGLVPCSDGVGVVTEVGSGSKWKPSDRVILVPNPSWLQGDDPKDFRLDAVLGGGDVDGSLRQWALVKDECLIRCPANLSLEEAATLPTAGGTAISALFHGPSGGSGGKGVRSGNWVLTQGTGGVSCFAIQLANAAGARVVSTSSSDEKLIVAGKLGARATVNYRDRPEWAEEVLKITKGRGVDHVVEVGGAGTIEQSIRALAHGGVAHGGVAHVVGILTESEKRDLVPGLLYGAKIGEYPQVDAIVAKSDGLMELTARGSLGVAKVMVEECCEMMEAHNLHPVIAEMFEWEEAPKAFDLLLKQNVVGKIVVKVG